MPPIFPAPCHAALPRPSLARSLFAFTHCRKNVVKIFALITRVVFDHTLRSNYRYDLETHLRYIEAVPRDITQFLGEHFATDQSCQSSRLKALGHKFSGVKFKKDAGKPLISQLAYGHWAAAGQFRCILSP